MTFARVLAGSLRLALPLYLVSLALGLLGAAVAVAGVAGVAGDRPWLSDLLGAGWVNTLIEVGLSATRTPSPGRTPLNLLALDAAIVPPVLLIMQWIAYTFLAGGIFEGLRVDWGPRAGSWSFWAGCRRWFWPFMRVGVMGMVFLVVLTAIGAIILALLGGAIRLDLSLVMLGAWLAILFGWLETARAAMTWHGDRSASRALERSIRLTAQPRALLVWLILALPAVGVLALSVSREAGGDALGLLGPLGTLIAGQAVAFIAAWMKVIRLAVAWRIAAGRRAFG